MSLLFLQNKQFYLLRFLFLFVLAFSIIGKISAQTVEDSIPGTPKGYLQVHDAGRTKLDTIHTIQYTADSISKRPLVKWKIDSSATFAVQILNHHPFFRFSTDPVVIHAEKKVFKGKETLFYVLSVYMIVFSLLRLAFTKYFNDLFRVFFRTTLKQRQIKEQLMQTPLPSFGFNIFFVATAGLYADFLLFHFGIEPVENFWLLFMYCSAGLSLIYFIKFVCLKLCGWLFNMKTAAEAYIFIVFIINKVIGIFLLPILLMIAFMNEPAPFVAFILSWCGIAILFLYRFILGYAAIRKEVRFNLFHFFLYLCAFEIAPLLLIYRLLLFFF
jgi:Domain of unknown function (DUF4271)